LERRGPVGDAGTDQLIPNPQAHGVHRTVQRRRAGVVGEGIGPTLPCGKLGLESHGHIQLGHGSTPQHFEDGRLIFRGHNGPAEGIARVNLHSTRAAQKRQST